MSRSLWKFFTSLRLTVVCLAVGIVLVFLGTLAQVEEGLYAAQYRWFRSFFIWWSPGGSTLQIPVFPGGYLVGFVLLANLISAHIKRFTWSSKKIGIQLTHLGVIVLLVGQLATDMLQRESHLGLREGESKSYSEDHRANELVFATEIGGNQEEIVSVPDAIVARRGEIPVPKLPIVVRVKDYQVNSDLMTKSSVTEAGNRLTSALATVEAQFATPDGLVPAAERAMESTGRVEIWRKALTAIGENDQADLVAAAKRIVPQRERAEKLCVELKTRFRAEMLTQFKRAGSAMSYVAGRVLRNEPASPEQIEPLATQGTAQHIVAYPLPEAKDGQTRNLPYVIVEVLESGRSLGTWFFHPLLEPQEINAGGKTIRAAYRFHRYYHPFTVKLLKTTHEVYPGTITAANPQGIPRNFQSRVEIDNPKSGEKREVDIYMNNPLRYGGLTFFQYQMGKEEMAGRPLGNSTLQVVRNPSWTAPYLGCIVVALGMSYQFLFHLIGFIAKRRQPAAATAPAASAATDIRRRPRTA